MKYLKMGITVFIAVYLANILSNLTSDYFRLYLLAKGLEKASNNLKVKNEKSYDELLAESKRALAIMDKNTKAQVAEINRKNEKINAKYESDMRTCKFWLSEYKKAIRRESSYSLEYTKMNKDTACNKVGL